ncbi:MAG: BCCT family transporter [Myxococcota bacterium]
MDPDADPNQPGTLDRPVFATSLVALLLAAIMLALAPEHSASFIEASYEAIATHLAPAYLWSAVLTLGLLGALAFGSHGDVTLGDPSEREFSNFSWFSMLFCAGIASGLLYWGTIEWASYFTAPPFGAEPRSDAAIAWATSYPLFHWGFPGWGFYALTTLAVGHAVYVRGEKSFRIGRACRPVIGRHADGALGRAIDVLFIVGLLGGASTSLGLAPPMIAAGLAHLTSGEPTFAWSVGVILACAAIFAASVYVGLDRGIRRLSDWNMATSLALVLFVLVVGPTLFILKMGTASIGHMLQHFVQMSFWTDPVQNTRFVEDWTVFYWAWWISYAPFVGMFVARISRGRSVREVIVGMLFLGSGGAWIYMIVLGNYALWAELTGVVPVLSILEAQGTPAAIVAVIASLPFGAASLVAFCVIALIYLATTFDSAAYTLAAGATRELEAGAHPERWHRMFWAIAIAGLPIGLMAIGGLRSLQLASLVGSVPLLGVGVVLAVSLVRGLHASSRRS